MLEIEIKENQKRITSLSVGDTFINGDHPYIVIDANQVLLDDDIDYDVVAIDLRTKEIEGFNGQCVVCPCDFKLIKI